MENNIVQPALSAQAEILLGAAFVILFGWQRFSKAVDVKAVELRARNLAFHSRCSTTALSYFAAMAAYLIILLLTYLFLQLYQPLMREFLKASEDNSFQSTIQALSPRFLSALLLTVLLPSIPVLRGIEMKFRGLLQRLASIPRQIAVQILALKNSNFLLPRSLLNDVVEQWNIPGSLVASLPKPATDSDPLELRPTRDPFASFVKATVLIHLLREWKTGRFATYNTDFQDVLAQIENEHSRALETLNVYLDAVKTINQSQDPSNKLLQHFTTAVSDLLSMIYEYISGGVLYSGLTEASRARELKSLGFQTPIPTPLPMGIAQATLILLFGWVSLLLGFCCLRLVWATHESTYFALLAVMISSMFCFAALTAILLWKKCDRPAQHDILNRPYHQYVLAGLTTAAGCLVLSAIFNSAALLVNDDSHFKFIWQIIAFKWPWVLIPATISAVTMFNMDNAEMPLWQRWKLRAIEATIVAGTSSLMAIVVANLLRDNLKRVPHEILHHIGVVPAAWQIVLILLIPTAFIGAWVPTLARLKTPRVSAPGGVPAPIGASPVAS